VVVLTQHRQYVKGKQLERMAVMSRRYKEFPLYVEALSTRAERYMEQRERIWELEREGRILVLAPETPVTVATTEHAGEPLLALYLQGRRQVEQRIDEIQEFLQ
jgi:predicted patatin/cPLA2 family phospholipase